MSRDFYRDHGGLSPDCFDDSEYLNWAQDNGLYVDAAGNVDYGPPEGARCHCAVPGSCMICNPLC